MNVDEFLEKGTCISKPKIATPKELESFHSALFKAFQQESHREGTRRLKVLSRKTDYFLS